MIQAGCASTATLTAVKPASVDVGPVRRIAIMEFSGPAEAEEIAQQAIVDQLSRDGFFTLVAAQELERFATAPLKFEDDRLNRPAAVEAARRMGLDAIMVGKLSRRRGGLLGSSGNVTIGDPVITVAVQYSLIDVHTGNVLASNRAEQSQTAYSEASSGSEDSEQQITKRLVAKCARQAVTSIAPHDVPVDVPLAGDLLGKGSRAVRAGNKLARQGDWQAAGEHWQEALAVDPENAAAAYNLGLAREAARDFSAAADLFATASRLGESEKAQQALQRLESSGSDYLVAMTQIHGRRQGAPHASPYGFASGRVGAGSLPHGNEPTVSPYTPPPAPTCGTPPTRKLQLPANASPPANWPDRRQFMRLPPE